eukprot:4851527-Heterocapsa_arctica.AAC.1
MYRKGKEKEGEEEQVDGQECRLGRQESRLDPKGATPGKASQPDIINWTAGSGSPIKQVAARQ